MDLTTNCMRYHCPRPDQRVEHRFSRSAWELNPPLAPGWKRRGRTHPATFSLWITLCLRSGNGLVRYSMRFGNAGVILAQQEARRRPATGWAIGKRREGGVDAD